MWLEDIWALQYIFSRQKTQNKAAPVVFGEPA